MTYYIVTSPNKTFFGSGFGRNKLKVGENTHDAGQNNPNPSSSEGFLLTDDESVFAMLPEGAFISPVEALGDVRPTKSRAGFKIYLTNKINVKDFWDVNNPATFSKLAQSGANIDAADGHGIKTAARKRNKVLTELYAKNGSKHVNDALIYSMTRRNPPADEIISVLLNNGADVNFNNGQPLFQAVSSGSLDYVKKMVDAGADVENNKKAYMQALSNIRQSYGDSSIASYLAKNGAKHREWRPAPKHWSPFNKYNYQTKRWED